MNHVYHTPVLADDVIRYVRGPLDGVYVDGTLGGGGHAERILMISSASRLIGFDADADAIASARERLGRFGDRVTFIHDNIANIRIQLRSLQIPSVHGFLLDLGVSSRHIDHSERGFSYLRPGFLDMRMDRRQSLNAWTVVNEYDQVRLANVLWSYGEERNSRKIARKIVEARDQNPIETTENLADLIKTAVGGRYILQTLARVFQAIRIEVNNELDNLRAALREIMEVLIPGGRIVVISYHSLEDRIVKEFFRDESRKMISSRTPLMPDRPGVPRLRILTKKPIVAGNEEVIGNPRARSAKLRAAERI